MLQATAGPCTIQALCPSPLQTCAGGAGPGLHMRTRVMSNNFGSSCQLQATFRASGQHTPAQLGVRLEQQAPCISHQPQARQ